METYTDTLPPLWWLRPWHHARRLHAAVKSLRYHTAQVWKWHDEHKANSDQFEDLIAELEVKAGKLSADLAHMTDAHEKAESELAGIRERARLKRIRSRAKPAKKKGGRRA